MALHLVFETSEARQVEVLRVVNRPIHVAVLVGTLVVPDALLAVGFTRNDRSYFLQFEEGAKRIRVLCRPEVA